MNQLNLAFREKVEQDTNYIINVSNCYYKTDSRVNTVMLKYAFI